MWHRRNDGFPKKVAQAQAFIEEIKKQKCPFCGKPSLMPITTEVGHKKDWETKIRCTDCGTTGTFNDTGYHMELQYHTLKEAAVKKA